MITVIANLIKNMVHISSFTKFLISVTVLATLHLYGFKLHIVTTGKGFTGYVVIYKKNQNSIPS